MKHLPILFAFLFMACVSSQKNVEFDPETYAATITAEELKEHLYTYAGDDFMGREAGTEGEDVAINYLKNEYESIGIDGGMPDGAYFMPMTLNSYRENRTLEASNVLAFIEGKKNMNMIFKVSMFWMLLETLTIESGHFVRTSCELKQVHLQFNTNMTGLSSKPGK